MGGESPKLNFFSWSCLAPVAKPFLIAMLGKGLANDIECLMIDADCLVG